jgi:hypothetical protein
MTLSIILIWINIIGCIFTSICLVVTVWHYHIGPRMAIYVVLNLASIFLLLCLSVYTLTRPPMMQSTWVYKLPLTFWWVKTLYFAWAIRFSSIKKN